MNKPKQIPHPELHSATRLTPLQLNAIHLAKTRSIIDSKE